MKKKNWKYEKWEKIMKKWNTENEREGKRITENWKISKMKEIKKIRKKIK